MAISRPVRACLRSAADDLEDALDAELEPPAAAYVEGAVYTLSYLVEECPTGPEAQVRPQPSAIETMEDQLATFAERAADPAASRLEGAHSPQQDRVRRVTRRIVGMVRRRLTAFRLVEEVVVNLSLSGDSMVQPRVIE